jgi:hypothetical protein
MGRPEPNDLVEPDLEAFDEQDDTKALKEPAYDDLPDYPEPEGDVQDPDAQSAAEASGGSDS